MTDRSRTKAEFKASREMLGMSQQSIADELGVTIRTIKRWESPKWPQVPSKRAWALMDGCLEKQREVVGAALGYIHETVGAPGAKPACVSLPYWATEEFYESAPTDSLLGVDGDWRMANANARVLASILWSEGIAVEWVDGNPAKP